MTLRAERKRRLSAMAKVMNIQSPPLNIREAAEFIGVSVAVMRAIVRRRQVHGFKLGGQWRIHRSALMDYLVRQIEASGRGKHRE